MGFSCGIIGLPNVGKSTIFNALTSAGAQMANYPFCTIDPNRAIIAIPDERLNVIARLTKIDEPIPAKIEFIDVAGLVKGASQGEGLGNRFLDHIRNVDAIIHVVRCFDAGDIVHVAGSIDPIRDIEIINTELLLADISVLERAREKEIKSIRSGDKNAQKQVEYFDKWINALNQGQLLINQKIDHDEVQLIQKYGLISNKPVLYLANCDEVTFEGDAVSKIRTHAQIQNSQFARIMGKVEEEISELDESEKQEYFTAMGITESGLKCLIQSSYELLNLITYYTAENKLQAWTLARGTHALKAAAKIHSDFERGFIRAEVFSFNDLQKYNNELLLREKGLIRSEGKEYIIQDGDVVRYLFNV